jgi:hypothetical protein
VDTVTNPRPAEALAQQETDDQLRRRAQGAFHGAVRGTIDALRFHLLSLEEVRDVAIVEEPNGIPGEIRVEVAYAQGVDTTAAQAKVDERILQVRPAGIRVVTSSATKRGVRAVVSLTLAGTGLNGTDLAALQRDVETKLVTMISQLSPGGSVRQSRVSVLLLEDPRIVDGAVNFQFDGESATAPEFSLAQGAVAEMILPVQFEKPQTEQASSSTVSVKVSAFLPIHLTPGTTQMQASTTIENAITSHLGTRAVDASLTFDSLAAAIRDDSRFALIRSEGNITIETGDRFLQLTDGLGEYRPGSNEILQKHEISIDVREGGV